MRLLNTTTHALTSFVQDPPLYAVLSHRWGDHEVSFHELTSGADATRLSGFNKIRDSARQAKQLGYDYIWIDTCCIDKTSSAELSEAINSMFSWYQSAGHCIVFLPDVQGADSQDFAQSVWFTRGWTLQELLAPSRVNFYDRDWSPIGTRESLAEVIATATRIQMDVLQGRQLHSIPACRKLSWASDRETTRPEDMAYSLMGILEVNMPLLYGEGTEKAFMRLQQTFISYSDDESIFAWTASEAEVEKRQLWGLLAPSPRFFQKSGSYSLPRFRAWRQGRSTESTNRGLAVSLTLSPLKGDASKTIFLAGLNCSHTDSEVDAPSNAVTIILQKMSDFEDQYARIRPDQAPQSEAVVVPSPSGSSSAQNIFVRSRPRDSDPVAGFCSLREQSILFDFPSSSPRGPVTLAGTAIVSLDTTPASAFSDPSSGMCCLGFTEKPLEPTQEAVDPRHISRRSLIARVKLKLSSTVKETDPPARSYSMKHKEDGPYLFVGFEPLPPNTMGTSSGFVRPWYSFCRTDTNSVANDLLVSAANHQAVYVAPGSCPFRVKFSPVSMNLRTFYSLDFVSATSS